MKATRPKRKRKTTPANRARKLNAKAWRAKAVALAADGMSLRAIAEIVGRDVARVHEAVKEAEAAVPVEDVLRKRARVAAWLETVIDANLPSLEGFGSSRDRMRASIAVTSAAREFARLFGLNEKLKLDVSGHTALSSDAHAVLLDRLNRLADSAAEGGAGEGDSEPQSD